jgi:hypothetical protein
MSRPTISNDFSYYRRLLPKFSRHPGVAVKDDDASGMALFTAEHIPMTSSIARAASQCQDKNAAVTSALALMTNSCYTMCAQHSFQRPEVHLFCARAMTGALVCYDHVTQEPQGVFGKKSPIKVKPIAQLLKRDFPQEQQLLNAIKYSTKHFKEASEQTQILFE